MNAAALLGRLKPNFRGVRLPRLRIGRRRFADDASGGRQPILLIAAVAGLAAALGGLAYWLDANAELTAALRAEAVPRVTVAIAGAGPPTAIRPADPKPPTDARPAAADMAAPPTAPAPPAVTAPPAAPAALPPPTGLPVPGPDGSIVLATAPAAGLVEDSAQGPLPRVAEDGRKPWQVYARPFPPTEKRPRIAIVMADMGLSGVTTGNALQQLPVGVTLAFVPYAERMGSWVERARGKGHEVMLAVPMEPIDYPRSDPGPRALLTALPPDRNIERLEWSLGKTVGYVGITSTTGGKLTANAEAMRTVMAAMKARGLLFLDARVTNRSVAFATAGEAGVPRAVVDRVIDRDLSRGAIDEQLHDLETIAKTNGVAIGLASPYPSTIERLGFWATGLSDRGAVLAPVSAVANLQKGSGG